MKSVQSGSLEQVDFLAGQVTFKAYLPNEHARVKASHPLTKSLAKAGNKWPQASKRAACPKDKLEFKFFSSPEDLV